MKVVKNTFSSALQTLTMLTLLSLSGGAFAQTSVHQNVRGAIIDRETKDPLSDATITIYHNEGESGTLSSTDGSF